jgi:hypothetical protein
MSLTTINVYKPRGSVDKMTFARHMAAAKIRLQGTLWEYKCTTRNMSYFSYLRNNIPQEIGRWICRWRKLCHSRRHYTTTTYRRLVLNWIAALVSNRCLRPTGIPTCKQMENLRTLNGCTFQTELGIMLSVHQSSAERNVCIITEW